MSLLAALKPPALEPQPAEHEKQADQSHFVTSRSRRTGALAGSGAASACRKETTSSRTRSKITSASALFSGSRLAKGVSSPPIGFPWWLWFHAPRFPSASTGVAINVGLASSVTQVSPPRPISSRYDAHDTKPANVVGAVSTRFSSAAMSASHGSAATQSEDRSPISSSRFCSFKATRYAARAVRWDSIRPNTPAPGRCQRRRCQRHSIGSDAAMRRPLKIWACS